jgi:Zn-dependent M28 family amino/carboxypeptidase
MTRLRMYSVELLLVTLLVGAVGFFAYLGTGLMQSATYAQEFSGERALNQAARQLEFGPRVSGTPASERMTDWLAQELVRHSWDVLIEPFTAAERVRARNIIAVRNHTASDAPVAIIGAHYDSRLAADADPNPANRSLATPGANSGAAGAAVLVELARVLDLTASGHTICLVFFDAEENGGLPGWGPAQGSEYFVRTLAESVPRCSSPRLAVILDLVGGTNQQLYIEQTGDASLSTALWQVAASQGFDDHFRNETKWATTDTHTNFLQAGIPAIMVADFDYPYRYTVEDTLDKLDADSLAAVGRTLEVWLESGAVFGE